MKERFPTPESPIQESGMDVQMRTKERREAKKLIDHCSGRLEFGMAKKERKELISDLEKAITILKNDDSFPAGDSDLPLEKIKFGKISSQDAKDLMEAYKKGVREGFLTFDLRNAGIAAGKDRISMTISEEKDVDLELEWHSDEISAKVELGSPEAGPVLLAIEDDTDHALTLVKIEKDQKLRFPASQLGIDPTKQGWHVRVLDCSKE